MTLKKTERRVTRRLAMQAMACACGVAGCDVPVQTAPTATPRVAPTAGPVAGSQSTLDQVCEIVSKQLNVERTRVASTNTLLDLHADELDLVEIVMELEDHFQIAIPDDDLNKVNGTDKWPLDTVTIKKLADIVDTCLTRRNAAGDKDASPGSGAKAVSN